MNLSELENKNIEKREKNDKKEKKLVEEISKDKPVDNPTINVNFDDHFENQRSNNDWKLILRLSVILALVIGLFVGSLSGFFVGKVMFQDNQEQSQIKIPDNGEQENEIYSQFDYEKIIINADKKITVENYYNDDEERFYAMQLIGKKLPELRYEDSKKTEYTTKDLGDGKYIIEFIEPQCAFCNSMIDTIDEYRAKENSINVIGLSIKSGDISAFNKKGETSFMLIQEDDETKNLVDFIVWVPTFMYVEDGTIKLVSFGRMSTEKFEESIDIAFN